jgi:hypothetical protein
MTTQKEIEVAGVADLDRAGAPPPAGGPWASPARTRAGEPMSLRGRRANADRAGG